MDYQMLFNIALSGVAFLAVWIFSLMWETIRTSKAKNEAFDLALKDLELKIVTEYMRKDANDVAMAAVLRQVNRIENIELMLVGQYVKKEEFTKALDNFSSKLDKMFDQMANKADK